jgi:hypothetical protein
MRGNLRYLVFFVAIVMVTLTVYSLLFSETFGAEPNPTGNPIGGGPGYTRIIPETDSGVKYVVATKDQLLDSLKNAQPGDVIYVKGDADINLTGTYGVTIPEGVILASDRGRNGSLGGRIFQYRGSNAADETAFENRQMLKVGGDNVRITGLRLEGPDKTTERLDDPSNPMNNPSVKGAILLIDNKGLEVDNCEIWGWSWAGIAQHISTGTGNSYIHHNSIHNCQADGYGYGFVIDGGIALIEANLFDYTRHAICGEGVTGEGYEARYNIHLGHGDAIGGHHFDVHGYPYNDQSSINSIAGNEYKIHHNTIELTDLPCVGIRALPETGVWIHHNIFKTSTIDPPVFQRSVTFGRMYMTQNYIGKKGLPPILVPGEDILYIHPA